MHKSTGINFSISYNIHSACGARRCSVCSSNVQMCLDIHHPELAETICSIRVSLGMNIVETLLTSKCHSSLASAFCHRRFL